MFIFCPETGARKIGIVLLAKEVNYALTPKTDISTELCPSTIAEVSQACLIGISSQICTEGLLHVQHLHHSSVSLKVLPPDRLFLLGSASPTPISTDYARQKHNDSAERIYFLSSARLRVFFKWSYAVPTILMLLYVLGKIAQGQTLTKDIINSFISSHWNFN